ncbi:MAG: aminotransferase class I/II-fold pyridoxal phosphate-dependent enzyme, partial [Treponema sp.]|nr:aminotransferase class I/II-fold pyridoxal phosphate-dependent enzyme [Treponema sp.]
MSVYWNRRVRELSPYIPGEQPRDRKFIKLNTNENPYSPSPKVAEAIGAALAGGGERLRLYPDPACTELREAAARRYGVKPEQVFAGNGSDEILAFAFGAFFEEAACAKPEAGPVLFPDITYSFYPVYAELWGVPFRTMPLGEDFSINADDYRVPAGGVILPNPNAPTGRVVSPGGLQSILAYHAAGNTVTVIDEAYAAFGAKSVVPLINEYPNLLTVHTLSKSASLAGLRAGFAIADEELIEGLCRIRDSFNSYTLDRLAQAGAAAALSDAAYYDEINRRVISARERVSAALAGMGFTVIPSQANFIFARHPRISGADFFARLRERGILARRFDKPRIRDFLRISIGTDDEMDV